MPPGPCSGGLWCFPLDVGDAERSGLASLLSAEEQARAARFRFEEHSRRFVVAHARLRQQLAALLETQPASLALESGEHGKPRLAGHPGGRLEFNLSHSGSLGLIGWAWGHAIGVDIEFWRRMSDEAALVRRYFSASEIAAYERLGPDERTPAFFHCWTRKEAYVKAVAGDWVCRSTASMSRWEMPLKPACCERPESAAMDVPGVLPRRSSGMVFPPLR